MTWKKPLADKGLWQAPAAPPQISEKELQRRIAAFKARGVVRIAGPDDPIYRSGLQMTSLHTHPRRVESDTG